MDSLHSQVHNPLGHSISRAYRAAMMQSIHLPGQTPHLAPTTGEQVELDPAEAQAEEESVPEGEPGSVLEVKYLHEVLDQFRTKYVLRPAPATQKEDNRQDATARKYAVFAFTVIRKFTPSQDGGKNNYNVSTSLQFNSEALIKIGTQVIGTGHNISWTARPLRLDPQLLISFLGELQAYLKDLEESLPNEPEESQKRTEHAHLKHLLDYLTTTHATTIENLSSLLAHGEITFDLLWALYVPRKTILCTRCPVTGEPRAARLIQAELCQQMDVQANPFMPVTHGLGKSAVGKKDEPQLVWRLIMEYVDVDAGTPGRLDEIGSGAVPVTAEDRPPPRFGLATLNSAREIHAFKGAKKISSLGAYPIQYYKGPGGEAGLRERLIARGKRWTEISGKMHHVAYRGLAFRFKPQIGYVKTSVNSRVIIDRNTFQDIVPNYGRFPTVNKTLAGDDIDRHAVRAGAVEESLAEAKDLTDNHLLLTSPIIYGFSLSDKQWLEFSVDNIGEIVWNEDAFNHLVIPAEQKMVLKTLVECHNAGAASKFDDFVSGKGLGLVVNLFGNPGVGKSLTAEGISEHLRKPLYVVGAAELGTTAEAMDANLQTVLKAASAWGAVVLIDEADVFLEERTLHLLERNAMVAVFLRQLEYFRGILFLTTNRVRVFDEAFQSRIHISLHYNDLSPDARRQIWVAFMRKVNGDIPNGGLSREELRELGEKKVNGRQIKNVVKTAGALAVGRGEAFGYSHLIQVLNLMEQFDVSHAMYQ